MKENKIIKFPLSTIIAYIKIGTMYKFPADFILLILIFEIMNNDKIVYIDSGVDAVIPKIVDGKIIVDNNNSL